MKYDKPLVAVLLGVLSTLPYELFTRLAIYFGIGKYSVYQLASLVITINRPTALIGAVVSSVVGGAAALVFYYSLKRLGTDYLLYKCIVFLLLVWVSMEVVFVWLIEGPKLVSPRPVLDYFIHLFGSLLFGLTMSFLFQKYLIKPVTKA